MRLRKPKGEPVRVKRGLPRGMSVLRVGVLSAIVLAALIYAGFTKRVPFRHHFQIQAVVTNSNLLAKGSPVRIAGVDIGKVAKIERYRHTSMALVTMQMDDAGLPVHRDATLKIRPRLFLEGNFYIDLQPGTPGAPDIDDRGLIPVTQTSTPVQLDQVLTALQTDTRGSLQQAVQGFGAGLNGKPSAADDADQDPLVHGLTGGQALNEAIRTGPQALRGTAKVTTALLGEQPDDLSRTIDGFAKTTTALADRQRDLTSFIHTFNMTMATTADHAADLRQIVDQLGPTSKHLQTAFATLDTALPPTRTYSRNLASSIKELPATIAASQPWLSETTALLSDRELGGLLKQLSPATQDLARLGAASREWLPKITAFNQCITNVFLPTGNIKVDDGSLSSNIENYKEFWYAMVGQNGESQGFDGNGSYLRLSAAGGSNLIESGSSNYGGTEGGPLFANATLPPLSTRPAYTNKLPPINRTAPCSEQLIPDVNGSSSTGPADGSKPAAAPPALPAKVN